ncbi:HAMP domain-containing sensor histidine kinase [Amycolatopsis rhabdoformis]|uniref:histidine kinase n=1 Tax=Amycolatopsis rhabdoformis TaxID=1448059 RepID=A0ABZ1HU79_9PSEU|nr:HAMP domain-containing sensor histidine kinase [Amycolatopsis rhabdoformis]WSE25977.1 HAMP domain-containing sensor histidine kinase [Amycolatopsis rhabdoformis]
MRRRIVTLTVLAAVVATVLFGLPLAVAALWYFREDTSSDLERAADGTALEVSDALAAGRVPRQPVQDTATVGIYDPQGRLVSGQGPELADAVVRQVSGADIDVASGQIDDNDVLAVPVMDGARLAGVVRAAMPHTVLLRRVGLTWLGMAGFGVAAVAASWLIARRIAGRLSSPLEELSTAATRLGEGDFTARAPRAGIPEIDRVGVALDLTAGRIAETLDRERAFSAEASHQLRTPLAGLRLQLEAALETPDTDPYEAIRAGIGSADRLERTIDDLLALSRERRAPRAELDLAAVLDELHRAGSALLNGRGMRVEVQDPPVVRASAAAVRQVLAVLLDNAITHGRGQVTVVARDAGAALAIDVTDAGPDLGDLDPFTLARSAPPGHGIGLRLARSLAEAEGGRLRLSSPHPPTFTLLLPAGEDPAGDGAVGEGSAEGGAPQDSAARDAAAQDDAGQDGAGQDGAPRAGAATETVAAGRGGVAGASAQAELREAATTD